MGNPSSKLGRFAPLRKWADHYSIDYRTLRKRLELHPDICGRFPLGVKNPLVERCYVERVMGEHAMRPAWETMNPLVGGPKVQLLAERMKGRSENGRT